MRQPKWIDIKDKSTKIKPGEIFTRTYLPNG